MHRTPWRGSGCRKKSAPDKSVVATSLRMPENAGRRLAIPHARLRIHTLLSFAAPPRWVRSRRSSCRWSRGRHSCPANGLREDRCFLGNCRKRDKRDKRKLSIQLILGNSAYGFGLLRCCYASPSVCPFSSRVKMQTDEVLLMAWSVRLQAPAEALLEVQLSGTHRRVPHRQYLPGLG
jgi:hypothetical protein